MSKSAIGSVVTAVLVGAMLAAPATARVVAPGDPDTSFNGTGVRSYQPRGLLSLAKAVVVQPDGKIVVVGNIGVSPGSAESKAQDVGILRINPDGSPDATFGVDGVVPIDFETNAERTSGDYAGGVALDAQGRILVVGTSYSYPNSGVGAIRQHATIARLRPNGTLDPTFSGDGKLVEDFGAGCSGGVGTSGDGLTDVVVQPDGRIRAVGYASGSENGTDMIVLGLQSNGARDCDYGLGGRVFFDSFYAPAEADTVALMPGGGVAVAGFQSGGYPALARLTSAGALVREFGAHGVWSVPLELSRGSVADLVVQPDGSIVLAVDQRQDAGPQRAGLVRVNPDGSTGALGGKTVQALPSLGDSDYAGSVVRDARGRLLLGTLAADDGRQILRLARFTPDGRPDLAFGVRGIVQILLGTSANGRGYGGPALAVQADGRIVAASSAAKHMDVRRFLSDLPSGRAAVSFLRAKVKVKAKQGTWSVACRNVAGDECRVSLTLKAKKKPKVKVGTATGTIAGGQSGVLTVKLNKAGKRLLGKGKLKVRAIGTSTNAAGVAVTIKQPVTLKAKKHG